MIHNEIMDEIKYSAEAKKEKHSNGKDRVIILHHGFIHLRCITDFLMMAKNLSIGKSVSIKAYSNTILHY